MLETCRRQNCERGTHTGSPSGFSDRAKHVETDNNIDPQMPLGACGPAKEFTAPGKRYRCLAAPGIHQPCTTPY